MKTREFEAKIVDDFKEQWFEEICLEERISREEAEEAYGGEEFDAFCNRISGKYVTLVAYEYLFGDDDYFEKEDNNFVIPRCLFEEVK